MALSMLWSAVLLLTCWNQLYLQHAAQAMSHEEVSGGSYYHIIIDAGSAGSRVHVFKWSSEDIVGSLTEVCHKKVHPAISTLLGKRKMLGRYLHDLVNYAEQCIPPNLWAPTKISLLATAGLRKMSIDDQEWMLSESARILDASRFLLGDVKVLSGDEEALYDWLAVVSVHRTPGEDVFMGDLSRGVVDMGGESKQIAFALREDMATSIGVDGIASNLKDFVDERCSATWEIQFPNQMSRVRLFSRSYFGFGVIASMNIAAQTYHDRWYDNLAEEAKCSAVCEADVSLDGDIETELTVQNDFLSSKHFKNCHCKVPTEDEHVVTPVDVEIPPLHPNQTYHNPCYAPGVFPPGSAHDLDYDLNGSGNFSACLEFIREIFTPKIPITDIICIQNMRNIKSLIGIDGFAKAAEILDIKDDDNDGFVNISPSEMKQKGTMLCLKNWNDLHMEFPHYMPYRAQRACFSAVFIYYLLVDIYGITENDNLSYKTLGYENDVSWTFGAALKVSLSETYRVDGVPFSVVQIA